MDAGEQGAIEKSDLLAFLAYIDHRLGLGTCQESFAYLSTYLGINGGGKVQRKEFVSRMIELEECLRRLDQATMNLEDLSTVMQRSLSHVDANGDGLISLAEFRLVAEKLQIPLDERQAAFLFSYFDDAKDGLIDMKHWREHNADSLAWISALRNTLSSEAERKGLARFSYFAHKVHEVLKGPGDPFAKAGLGLAIVWDGVDSFADALTCTSDAVGVCTALFGIWQEVSGVSTFEDVDDMNLAPFVIFLGITGVHMLRHYAEGQESDLSERESLLYAQAFRGHGFSIADFKKLIHYGQARWEHYEAGEEVGSAGDGALRVVARGSCRIQGSKQSSPARVGAGGFLFDGHLCEQLAVAPDSLEKPESGPTCDQVAKAAEAATVVVWDSELLQTHLARDENLKMRVHGAVVASMADRLLDAAQARQEEQEVAERGPGQSAYMPSPAAAAAAAAGARGDVEGSPEPWEPEPETAWDWLPVAPNPLSMLKFESP